MYRNSHSVLLWTRVTIHVGTCVKCVRVYPKLQLTSTVSHKSISNQIIETTFTLCSLPTSPFARHTNTNESFFCSASTGHGGVDSDVERERIWFGNEYPAKRNERNTTTQTKHTQNRQWKLAKTGETTRAPSQPLTASLPPWSSPPCPPWFMSTAACTDFLGLRNRRSHMNCSRHVCLSRELVWWWWCTLFAC